jgi:hypothetical protein
MPFNRILEMELFNLSKLCEPIIAQMPQNVKRFFEQLVLEWCQGDLIPQPVELEAACSY